MVRGHDYRVIKKSRSHVASGGCNVAAGVALHLDRTVHVSSLYFLLLLVQVHFSLCE